MSTTSSDKKKSISGFLNRSKRKSKDAVKSPLSEADLLAKTNIVPEDVLRLSAATESNLLS